MTNRPLERAVDAAVADMRKPLADLSPAEVTELANRTFARLRIWQLARGVTRRRKPDGQ